MRFNEVYTREQRISFVEILASGKVEKIEDSYMTVEYVE